MAKRRDFIKLGLTAGAAGLLAPRPGFTQENLLKFLCSPDGIPPEQITKRSPACRPFAEELKPPPVKEQVLRLDPPPDPGAHQRYDEFAPKRLYEIHEQEFRHVYHPDPPYNAGSWAWGFDGVTPGPTYHARYGEPILVRMFNDLPPVGSSNISFALPSTTTHLHNAHSASESDGNPMDWVDTGEFWDHHYCNFPSGQDSDEKLSTLWYHDHRMDFTAPNVYAGLDGFYLLFDEQDSGNENDPDPQAWRLPSGNFDIPLVLHDVRFDENAQPAFNRFQTDGILGDKYTVNRKIQPFLRVERRKYRFRILNGGPSRFYRLFLSTGAHRDQFHSFIVITGDGNFLTSPLCAESITLSVAQRVDVILDFSQFNVGDQIFLQNRLEQTSGKGPSERLLDPGDDIMRFDVIERQAEDKSRIPGFFRNLPEVNMKAVKRHREWVFDYMGGMWTVNGKPMDPHRVDAAIEQGSAEIWTIRNDGKNWSHPIHSHFTEFILLEVNGRQVFDTTVQSREHRRNELVQLPSTATEIKEFKCRPEGPIKNFLGGKRRDITTLFPNDEIKIYMRWRDFLGKYVLHCHNVVHEDHAMMIRWDIVEPGKGF
jgi:FtsP/CotA-like multicopper oxidase with cupredoxin domain